MNSYLAIFLTILFWAAAFPAIRAGLDGYSAGHLVLLRFLTSSAVLLVAWLLRGRKAVAWRDLPAVALLGFLGMTVYPLALTAGERTVASGTASILVSLSPIFTALLGALLLGERLPKLAWGGVAIAFTGSALIALSRGARLEASTGELLVLLAAFVLGAQFVLAKSLLRRYDAVTLTVFSVFCGTAFDLVASRGFVDAVRNAPLGATLAVVFLGIFATAVATITWSLALARVAASTTVMFLYLVAPLSLLIAWFWLGEVPSPVTIAGGALSIAGVAVVRYASFAASASSASPLKRKIVHSSTALAPSDL